MSSPIQRSPIAAIKNIFRTARLFAMDRYRRTRGGSVLILVVAVLVLLALIGTAALSTNTIDRYATQQNTNNTEIDLLVEGVKNMAKAVIVGDLYNTAVSPPVYRQAEGTAGSTYDNWDMPLMFDPSNPPPNMDQYLRAQLTQANDAWLSPRYPALLLQGPGTANEPPLDPLDPLNTANVATKNRVVWDCIGAPLELPTGVQPAGGQLFDTPYSSNGVLSFGARVTDRTTATPVGLIPTFIKPATVTYPALLLPTGQTVVAADADGDGIADEALKKLPIGDINGLTYYYAARIIDNGAAINVNTAWSRDHEFLDDTNGTFAKVGDPATNMPSATLQSTNFFPTNIGLAELLRSYNNAPANLKDMEGTAPALTELGQFDSYRLNTYLRPSGVVDDQSLGYANAANNSVYVDMPPGSPSTATAVRSDFAYNTIGEALYFGLDRRLNNPGVVAQVGAADVHYQRYGVSEDISLAYHFCMANSNATPGTIETQLATATNSANGTSTAPTTTAGFDSLFWTSGNKIPLDNTNKNYRATILEPLTSAFQTSFSLAMQNFTLSANSYPSTPLGIGIWFNDNFNWDAELNDAGGEVPAQYRNRRTMFVTDNPVSNQIPGGTASVTGQTIFCKASVNTATFDALYAAYHDTMIEGGKTPYEGTSPPSWTTMYLYAGSRFTQPAASTGGASDPQANTEFTAATNDTNPYRMFRNAVRDNGAAAAIGDRSQTYNDTDNTVTSPTDSTNAVHMEPTQMLKLRSFLAAANTIGMRSANGFPISVQAAAYTTDPLRLMVNGTATPVDLVVYPVEYQPYITEVYANTDTNLAEDRYIGGADTGPKNTEPYVAIELFFPYPINAASATTPAAGGAWDMRPYSSGTISNPGWIIGLINRESTKRTSNSPIGSLSNVEIIHQFDPTATTTDSKAIFDLPSTALDPRYGSYILLENYDETGTDTNSKVQYRPQSTGLPPTGSLNAIHTGTAFPPLHSVYVADLARLIKNGSLTHTENSGEGGELVILKPYSGATAPPAKPIDSFDFTGLSNDSGSNTAHVWHYSRKGKATVGTGSWWSFIYPGRYDGGLAAAPRHQGVQRSDWNNDSAGTVDHTPAGPPGNHDPFATSPPLTPGITLGVMLEGTTNQDNASPSASFPVFFQTQLLNYDQPGWNSLIIGGGQPANPNKFPFGAFARNSDILQVPFFGAYRITPAVAVGTYSPSAYEINATPMDASFCEDTDPNDDPPTAVANQSTCYEQLGRFCPLTTLFTSAVAYPAVEVDDLDWSPETYYRYGEPPDPGVTTKPDGSPYRAWRYHWATRIFDYLTVQDPQTDSLPNVDPATYLAAGNPSSVYVSNEGSTAGGLNAPAVVNAENGVPLHGLININTASWRVLSSINWTPYALNDAARDQFGVAFDGATGEYTLSLGADGIDDNIELAKAITWWRDGIRATGATTPGIGPNGPFRSLMDLYRVTALKQYYRNIAAGTEPDDALGDFSPNNYNKLVGTGAGKILATDEIRGDFEEKFLLLSRVGNLITTRSDSFTVYIDVEGWRNVGSTDVVNKPPTRVVQRRAAFILDRSGITPTGGQLKIVNVPTE